MNARTHAQRLRGGVLLYALSVASGLANFAALKILQHITPQPSIYSQLSTILLSFTTFQLLTDLGTQTQFIHSFRNADITQRQGFVHLLLQSRLALGCAALLLSFVYVVAANFSPEMSLSFLIYQAAFIPFAYMSTADSIFLAREEFGKAILSRLARIVALFCFLSAAAATSANSLVLPALFSTLSFCISAILVWFAALKGKSSAAGQVAFLQVRWWRERSTQERAFLRGSGVAGIVVIFHFVQSFVAQIYLVRSLGEQSLTTINTALVIATPAILAFQTLGQIQLPAVSDWVASKNIHLKKELLKFFLKMLIAFVVMCSGLAIAQTLGWVNWFFPLSSQATVELTFLFMTAHAILCFAGPLQVLCQYQARAQPLLFALAISVLLSWFSQFALTTLSQEWALLVALLLFALLISAASLFISTQKKIN